MFENKNGNFSKTSLEEFLDRFLRHILVKLFLLYFFKKSRITILEELLRNQCSKIAGCILKNVLNGKLEQNPREIYAKITGFIYLF